MRPSGSANAAAAEGSGKLLAHGGFGSAAGFCSSASAGLRRGAKLMAQQPKAASAQCRALAQAKAPIGVGGRERGTHGHGGAGAEAREGAAAGPACGSTIVPRAREMPPGPAWGGGGGGARADIYFIINFLHAAPPPGLQRRHAPTRITALKLTSSRIGRRRDRRRRQAAARLADRQRRAWHQPLEVSGA
eukprot:SAG31_NODE_11881_length_989_cov_0.924719_1_plen_190_part_00